MHMDTHDLYLDYIDILHGKRQFKFSTISVTAPNSTTNPSENINVINIIRKNLLSSDKTMVSYPTFYYTYVPDAVPVHAS